MSGKGENIGDRAMPDGVGSAGVSMSRILEAAAVLGSGVVTAQPSGIRIDEKSVFPMNGITIAMATIDGKRGLLALGEGRLLDGLPGSRESGAKFSPLTTETRKALGRIAPFTVPVPCSRQRASIGLGDRLGLATPGHIRAVRGRDVFPVFAQQSMRELTLTGRDYEQVLDDAAFAVFAEGFRAGYGADADHLNETGDIDAALAMGFSMITLDCVDQIDISTTGLDDAAIAARYASLDGAVRARYEARYLDAHFKAGDTIIAFDRSALMRSALVYHRAIDRMAQVHRDCIAPCARPVDFEISIDETVEPTSPAAHYMVARELAERGIAPSSVAPRFCGEFQKGIDYRGDIARLERELATHAAIADTFGYRLSVHSGSDKFSVFPLVGRCTAGRFHVKTAGTNWLEAVRVVAREDPALYRDMHRYAIEHFTESQKHYRVDATLAAIPPLERTDDRALSGYMDQDDARQLMHISYGQILGARDAGDGPLFRERFFALLETHADEYADRLARHIGRHLDALGI
jgi:tagaturonate epimerase